jgi:hypothetical protein
MATKNIAPKKECLTREKLLDSKLHSHFKYYFKDATQKAYNQTVLIIEHNIKP